MGQQKTTLSQSIDIISDKEKYDAACKKVLAEKIVLAWIMKHTMKEYKCFDVQEIAQKYIEGRPRISKTGVMPDETNAPWITGAGVEDSSLTEHTVTYDIQFHAVIPDTQEPIEMIINVEAQNDFYPGYPIIKRGIYYCSRMVSSQYGTVFTNSHYEKIQKVYSIWICMTPPDYRANTITQYSMKEENIVGEVKELAVNYDLLTAVIICLGNYDADDTEDELLKMLDVLLAAGKHPEEKKQILENEFGIPMTENMKGEMEKMGSLADGVERRGIEKGIKIGIEQGIEQTQCIFVMNMLKENVMPEMICRIAECDEAFVEQMKKKMKA